MSHNVRAVIDTYCCCCSSQTSSGYDQQQDESYVIENVQTIENSTREDVNHMNGTGDPQNEERGPIEKDRIEVINQFECQRYERSFSDQVVSRKISANGRA